jgi:hypothetical protein
VIEDRGGERKRVAESGRQNREDILCQRKVHKMIYKEKIIFFRKAYCP